MEHSGQEPPATTMTTTDVDAAATNATSRLMTNETAATSSNALQQSIQPSLPSRHPLDDKDLVTARSSITSIPSEESTDPFAKFLTPPDGSNGGGLPPRNPSSASPAVGATVEPSSTGVVQQDPPAVASSKSTDSAASLSLQGGRLWRLAGEEARRLEEQQQPHAGQQDKSTTARNVFMGTFQSRADPTAASPVDQRSMVRLNKGVEDADLMGLGVARKRVRVTQLLVVGTIGFLLGLMGNFYVGYSCHFASVNVRAGSSSEIFTLHFGLWKYSPVDSALEGYSYCYPYDSGGSDDPPISSRIVNLMALFFGTGSLVVLWWYLITGRVFGSRYDVWRWAVYSAFAAAVLQTMTPLLFLGISSLCYEKHSCSPGPASYASLVPALAWVVLGWEISNCQYAPPSNSSGRNPGGEDDDVESKAILPTTTKANLELAHNSRPENGYHPPQLLS